MYVLAQAPPAAILTNTAGGTVAQNSILVAAGEPGAGTQLNLNAPGSNRLLSPPNSVHPFVVRASGYVSIPAGTATSSATPIQFIMYASNTASFAAASGNAIYSSTAIAAFTLSSASAVNIPWELEVEFVGAPSGRLIGKGQFMECDANGVQLGSAAPTSAAQLPTSMNFANEPPIQFALSVNYASSGNLGAITTVLESFVLEA